MPIYELYCLPCHTVYSFFTSRVADPSGATCPRCGHGDLERKPSRFATVKTRAGDEGEDPLGDLDASRLEEAMNTLLADSEGMGETEDPREMGRLMRRFSHLTGLGLGERMEDMIARLEAGEDPDRLEAEMSDAEDGDDPSAYFEIKRALNRRQRAPKVDEQLYFL